MKKTSLLALALVAGFASASNAKISQYATGKVSLNDVHGKIDVTGDVTDADEKFSDIGAGISLGYGLDFGNNFRSDVEISYNLKTTDEKTYDEGDKSVLKTKSTSVMLNGYYDIKTGTEWTPYITAGIGYSHVENGGDENDWYKGDNFAYQAGVGTSYALTSNIALDAGYKYVDLGKVDVDSEVKVKNRMNQFSIGARMAF